jgi:hypothetical protein
MQSSMFWWRKINCITEENCWITEQEWEYNIKMKCTEEVHEGWQYMKLVQKCVMLQALILTVLSLLGFTIALLVGYPQNTE